MAFKNQYQLEKDFKHFNELCAALNSLESLIYSDFFKQLSPSTQKRLHDDYLAKLKFKTLINEQVLIDEYEAFNNQKSLIKLRENFPNYRPPTEPDIVLPQSPKLSKSSQFFNWCWDNLFFYNNFRLKNVYPMALEEGMIKTLKFNAQTLSNFNHTTATISAGSGPFINIIRECQALFNMITISFNRSLHVSTAEKFSLLFTQRFKRLIYDFYWALINGLSFFELRNQPQIREILSFVGLGLDVVLNLAEINIVTKYHHQIEQEILNHIKSIFEQIEINDGSLIENYTKDKLADSISKQELDELLQKEGLLQEVEEIIKVYQYLQAKNQRKREKLYMELYLSLALLLAFFILSGFCGFFPGLSDDSRHLLLLIGALLAVVIQISNTVLEIKEEQDAETNLQKIKALEIKMYSDILSHCLFPGLSLLTNLAIRPALGFELPNLFVLLSLIGLTKVIIDLINACSIHHQNKLQALDNERGYIDIKINAIKAFAMLELVGLIAWSEYTPIISDLSFNPILLSAIVLFLALHLYAHLNGHPQDNNNYQMFFDKKD